MPFCTFSLFTVAAGNRLAALRAFVGLRRTISSVPGVRFGKVMGCGRGAVFSLWPDWGRWAFMIEWERAQDACDFSANRYWQQLHLLAEPVHYHLLPFRHTGQWDRKSPFQPAAETDGRNLPLAVLTRADINPVRIGGFVRFSYKTSDAIEKAEGLLLSLGMGEVPLLRQATLSIWKSTADMERYVYADPAHREAMQRKRRENWFLEEMFVRFYVIRQGSEWEKICLGEVH